VIARLALLALCLAAVLPVPAAFAVSLADIEDEVMCPTCQMPLDRSQSPQANDQRTFIRDLIAQGQSKAEIKDALVGEYGEAVLADPPREGFGWAAVFGPLALIAILGIGLATVLPRRRRARQTSEAGPPGPQPLSETLSAADTARLDAELAAADR
jgi:cytochrome c-type biogenesis protein CcmH